MSWYLLTYQGRNVQGELTKGQNIHKSLMVSVTVIQHPLHCKHVLSQIAWTWLSPIHSLQDAVSMIFNIHLPTKDSSSLLSVGVRDIGLWSDCNDFGGLTFGAGIVLACFQTGGTNPSRTNVLKIAHNGPEINSAMSLKIQFGMPSGPGALFTWTQADHLSTSSREIT